MIICNNNTFVLNTDNTTYAFRVMDTGHLEHLYYGKKIRIDELCGVEALCQQNAFAPGNTINYDEKHGGFTMEDMCLEVSAYGKGDIRDSFVNIIHADGSATSDFIYDSHSVIKGKSALSTLPSAYGEENEVEELTVVLKDASYDVTLELKYAVFASTDVITRSSKIINNTDSEIKIDKIMSLCLDIPDGEYTLSTFHGNWVREMNKVDRDVTMGRYVGGSMTGTSSNRNNPLMILAQHNATQSYGKCIGVNLIYSGNHYESVERSSFGKVRVLNGIQPEGFEFILEAGEAFEAPEAVLAFSDKGYNGISNCMHEFVRNHIVRGNWKNKPRPILINSWEANYFDINESKLLKLAKVAKKVGIELFVMDDGWFGERDDDRRSLGDWTPNPKKLPGGVKGLCDKINDAGLEFGIWVEPEMVNVDSNLYREHPDWCLAIPGKAHSEGRTQRVLDLCREDVQEYIIQAMSDVFGSANIFYVKWDMNRNFTDYYSQALDAAHQGEVAHRYVMGLYRVMGELTKRFPDILFEGCSSGGNRFDLGILSYFPQIWGSDNTDAICRASIQNGYSYGYPPETIGSHVSVCPNHQTLRETPLETRFAVASFGSFGYECNLCDMKKEEIAQIEEQVKIYKGLRENLWQGHFYRGKSFDEGNNTEWTYVSRDGRHGVGMVLQKLCEANKQFYCYRAMGLNEDMKYHFSNRFVKYNIKEFGDLVNTVAPIHVKKDSLLHNAIAKVIKLDGETEDVTAYGDTLMEAGVKLKPAFSGTGFDDRVRFFPDFAARLYYMDESEEQG